MSENRPLRALVIFDSRYGNTARIADDLAQGLRSTSGVTAETAFASEVRSDQTEAADLVVIGGPTEYLTRSAHIKQLFGRIEGFDFSGKLGFAFDTHSRRPASGSAARYIEREMLRLRLQLLQPRESAITELRRGPAGEARPEGQPRPELVPGTELRFRTIGSALGAELVHAWDERRKTQSQSP
jgi:flavodoxin